MWLTRDPAREITGAKDGLNTEAACRDSIPPAYAARQRGLVKMSASDRFTELKQQVEQSEQHIRAAAAEDSAQLEAKAEEARKAADEHADQFRAMAQKTSEQAEGHWNELQSSWDEHIQHVRQRIAQKKAEHDVAAAESDAEWAEADAANAVDFAEAAVVEAEYAVLDAAVARTRADAMAS